MQDFGKLQNWETSTSLSLFRPVTLLRPWMRRFTMIIRGEVEDTRLEAKDTKKI